MCACACICTCMCNLLLTICNIHLHMLSMVLEGFMKGIHDSLYEEHKHLHMHIHIHMMHTHWHAHATFKHKVSHHVFGCVCSLWCACWCGSSPLWFWNPFSCFAEFVSCCLKCVWRLNCMPSLVVMCCWLQCEVFWLWMPRCDCHSLPYFVYWYIYIYIYMHTYIHTHTHACIHTHMSKANGT